MKRVLLVAAALAAAPSFAQKPQAPHALELGTDPTVAVSDDGLLRTASGQPTMQTGLNLYVAPGSYEAMARQALEQAAPQVGLRRGAATGLEKTYEFTGQAGTVVRFRQTVQGVPVWGAETVVNLDRQDRAQLVINAVRDDVAIADVTPAVSAAAARQAAFDYLGVSGELRADETRLMVWPADDGARLAYQVRVAAAEPMGDWEAIVDARTGALVRVADRSVFHGGGGERPTALPTVETSPLYRVDATGMIFDPNPLTRAGVAYGGGYRDNNDADSPQLTAARTSVTLRDVSFNGTTYNLNGPWAEIREIESPAKGLFPQTTPDWSFTRTADGFEAATTYWHIDNYMRYVNETLGVPVRPTLYTGGVRFDAHGLNGADNSRYSRSAQDLSFGEGCVDDNEDADVIIHELGHGLHDWLAGAISQVDGLSEGLGDYVAVSYTRSLGLLAPFDASYSWVFKWDGHNECWPGRTAAVTTTYPSGSVPHARGQNWATANMRIWNAIGGEKADKAVFEGIRMTNGSTTQPQAAAAAMQAAANMNYSFAEQRAMYDNYVQQNYTGLTPPSPPVAGEDRAEALAAGELTAASPNPFNGQTAFELSVAVPQRVRVEVLDVLGRQVAVLFEGEMLAGQRYPFSLDAAGLRPGVYVYRAVGEAFQAARRVTLAQ